MANTPFGTLNFSTSFDPTSGFPLDARTYCSTYEEAVEKAQQAGPVGSKEHKYHYGLRLFVVTEQDVFVYVIKPDKTLKELGSGSVPGGSGTTYEAGDNIKIENGKISVITTNEVAEDNTKPITSAGVFKTVGNIDSLLNTI